MITLHGSIPSKKNSRQNIRLNTGRIISVTNSIFNRWHKVAEKEVLCQKRSCGKVKRPCQIEIQLFAPNKRAGDLTNRAESIMDLLVDCGIIPDDNWFEVPQVILKFGGVDRQNPRAEVTLN